VSVCAKCVARAKLDSVGYEDEKMTGAVVGACQLSNSQIPIEASRDGQPGGMLLHCNSTKIYCGDTSATIWPSPDVWPIEAGLLAAHFRYSQPKSVQHARPQVRNVWWIVLISAEIAEWLRAAGMCAWHSRSTKHDCTCVCDAVQT